MSEIPSDLVDKMMVSSARHCCICRRFRPTKLQVHHIVERNQGGTNDEDNLIVICLTCHSDVHTKVPFARRFSVEELKGHRDAVIRMVQDGKLSLNDADDTDDIIRRVVQGFRGQTKAELTLMPEAVELLLGAVKVPDSGQGSILVSRSFEGVSVVVGGGEQLIDIKDQRTAAKFKRAVSQLLQAGLAEQLSKEVFEVTYEGYLAADEIMTRGSQALA
jgi:hypothetical protein